jgi:hypothetical protein
MRNKLWFVLAFVFLIALTTMVIASAENWTETNVSIKDMKVYVKGEMVWHGICTPDSSTDPDNWDCEVPEWNATFLPSIEACEKVDVKVAITGGDITSDNAVIRSWFRVNGETIEDETGMFDIYQNNQYVRTMFLKMPCNVKELKIYTLNVEVEADDDLKGVYEAEIKFDLQRLANELSIKSVNVRTPCVSTCSTVYADVVVKNIGNHELNDIYVKATIKELGVSGQRYIDLLVPYKEDDESISQEVTIAIQLPSNVQPGTYTLEVAASSEEADTAIQNVQFVLSGAQQEQTSIEVTPQVLTMDVTPGSNAVYTMIVTNRGTTSQTFTVETTGLDWATVQLNPATFILSPGESKLVSLYVTAKDNVVAGEHVFSAKVKYGNELKTVNFTANVVEGKKTLDTKTVLMIVGIVLAVAIIILLIVLLAQKGKNEEKAEESYY